MDSCPYSLDAIFTYEQVVLLLYPPCLVTLLSGTESFNYSNYWVVTIGLVGRFVGCYEAPDDSQFSLLHTQILLSNLSVEPGLTNLQGWEYFGELHYESLGLTFFFIITFSTKKILFCILRKIYLKKATSLTCPEALEEGNQKGICLDCLLFVAAEVEAIFRDLSSGCYLLN